MKMGAKAATGRSLSVPCSSNIFGMRSPSLSQRSVLQLKLRTQQCISKGIPEGTAWYRYCEPEELELLLS